MNKIAGYIIKEHGKLKGKRVNWESHWQEVAQYMLPRKRNVFDFRSQPGGDKRQDYVFDNTAVLANNLLGAALQGMLTNPAAQWVELITGIPELDNNKDVRQWLQKATRRVLEILNNTNFHAEMHEVYIDLGSLGTAVLRIEEDKDHIVRFHCRPVYEHWIKEDARGIVDTVTREYKMTGRQLKQEVDFEKVKDLLDENDKFALEKIDQDLEKEWNIIHWVGPREDIKVDLPKIKRFNISSIKIIEELGVPFEVGGFEEFPYVVSRWTKTSGEEYGRSPGIEALPEIKMINKMMETTIKNAEKVVDPSLQVPDDGMLLPIRTIPGGINYYRAGTKDLIVPLQTGGDIRLSFELMEQVRGTIKQFFYVDQLQLVESDRMTAVEVLQRTEEKLRVLGPVLGRQNFELLKPLINRVIGIAARRDLLPPNPPDELRDIELRMEFSSPIARAQKATEADNIQRVLGLVGPIAGADPSILQNINGDGYIRYLGNLFNVPQEMFRSEKEVKQIREAQAQQQQAMMQAEQQNINSQTAKNLGLVQQNG